MICVREVLYFELGVLGIIKETLRFAQQELYSKDSSALSEQIFENPLTLRLKITSFKPHE